MRTLLCPVLACAVLGACTTSPYTGRSQINMPQPVNVVYSEMDMRLKLVTSFDHEYRCVDSECDANREFDLKIARLGLVLADKAFEMYPEVRERVKRFEFVVADKIEPGTTSNASGTVVIFRGVSKLELSDEALAFVIAREMGHVIGNHHGENTVTSIVASVVAQILLPVGGLFRAISFLPGASSAAAATATTGAAATGAATATAAAAATAASFLGSKAVMATYWPKQLQEGDVVALHVLARTGRAPQDIVDGLEAAERHLTETSWTRDLRTSKDQVAEIAQGPRLDKETAARLAEKAPLSVTSISGATLDQTRGTATVSTQ